jgi:hypothetical protein
LYTFSSLSNILRALPLSFYLSDYSNSIMVKSTNYEAPHHAISRVVFL